MEVHVKHIQFTKNCVKLTSGFVKGVFIGLGRKIKTSPLVCSKCSAMHRHGKLRELCAASQRVLCHIFFEFVYLAWRLSLVRSLRVSSDVSARKVLKRKCLCDISSSEYHKSIRTCLITSEIPSNDDNAVLASPISSSCSPVPAICITPEMIAINIYRDKMNNCFFTDHSSTMCQLIQSRIDGHHG